MNNKRIDVIITEAINKVLLEKDTTQTKENETVNINSFLLDEMARINRNEQNIFPWQTYLIEVRYTDHQPPHFHIVYTIKNGTKIDISFLIESGDLYRINSGDKNADYSRLTNNVKEWLGMKSATRPQTNQENALATWDDLHG